MTDTAERLRSALVERYHIERELGAGGMATVYQAHDRRHDRRVAVKVLRPELASEVGAERFLREIKLAAGLTHPHIMPLFDSGEAGGFLYYVMPVVEGTTLRERLQRDRVLPVEEAVRLVSEIAEALDYAHTRNVVHRDIKPENILLQHGHALVADFGIGKALSAEAPERTTQAGIAIGTPAYMSPEQAAGDRVDGRSDLYSLGCVFYELLAGEQPFTGPTAQAVIARRFSMAAPDVTKTRENVPTPVALAVSRLLAREPADRFTKGRELADVLRNARGFQAMRPEEKSLAVLPFTNMSADPENEYFSDGITEEIINALVQLPDLRVAARTSVFAFKGKHEDLRAVAEKLNVRTILEGSVRKAGDRLRITAQLINAADGYHLWSERFDRKLDDIFEVQDEIARTIAEKLKVRLAGGGEAQLVKPSTASTEAYELYLQGRHFWAQRGQGLIKGLRCFEAALEKDQNFALAYAGIADVHTLLGFYGYAPAHMAMPRARAAAERALAIDPNLAEAYNALGFIHLSYDWDIPAALAALERALALKPTYVPARYWYASALVANNEIDRAIAVDEEAVRIEPLNLFSQAHVGWMLLTAHRYAEAAPRLEHAVELDQNFVIAHWLLGQTYIALDRHEDGIAELRQAVALSGNMVWMVATLASALAHIGRVDEARELLREIHRRHETEYVRAFLFAQMYSRLGDNDTAYVWLERAREERDSALPYSYASGTANFFGMATAQELIDDPRWEPFVASLGIRI